MPTTTQEVILIHVKGLCLIPQHWILLYTISKHIHGTISLDSSQLNNKSQHFCKAHISSITTNTTYTLSM